MPQSILGRAEVQFSLQQHAQYVHTRCNDPRRQLDMQMREGCMQRTVIERSLVLLASSRDRLSLATYIRMMDSCSSVSGLSRRLLPDNTQTSLLSARVYPISKSTYLKSEAEFFWELPTDCSVRECDDTKRWIFFKKEVFK